MQNQFFSKMLIVLMISMLFSILFNSILLKFSKNLGKRNSNENLIRWADESKPSLGGISFYIIFLITFSVYSNFFSGAQVSIFNKEFGILSATSLAFLMGLSDDAYNTKPLLKFFTQIICALILILTDTYIQIFDTAVLNYLITIFWVVGMMNSLNMLDNMDGITTIVSIFVLFATLLIGLHHADETKFFIILICGVIGGLLGFLRYNWHPSKMFMGDTGSQFLGLFLSAAAIDFLWNNHLLLSETASISKSMLLTIIAFILPIADTFTVSVNRLKRGHSPFVGGKDHTTHHLSYMGLSDVQVAWIFVAISLVSSILVIIIEFFIVEWNIFLTIVFGVYALSLIALLFGTTQHRKAKKVFYEKNRKNFKH